MQPRAVAVLALCALASCAAAAEESLRLRASLLRASKRWLQHHAGAPKTDELAELKDENPEAYAIVKALLTKRSLGLLDPRHPSASFAAPPPSKEESVPQGPAVFAKFASKVELEKMESHPAAPAEVDNSEVVSLAPARPANRNWLNWKPAQSDDDAMVSSVLGGDAGLSGKSLIGRDRGSVSATATEVSIPVAQPALTAATDMQPVHVQPILPLHPENAPAVSQPVQLQPGALTDPKENNYLDTVGSFGVDFTPELKKTAGGQAVKQSVHEDHNNYLASFSWDDSKPAAPPAAQQAQTQQALQPEAQQPTEQKQPQAAPATSSGNNGALLAWLGGGSKKAAQVQTRVEVQTTPKPTWQNSYLAELS